MADTGLSKLKCVTFCVEDCDCVPPLNLRRCQFTASAIGVEEQRNCPAVNIFDGHLQTEECAEVDNLAQEHQCRRGR